MSDKKDSKKPPSGSKPSVSKETKDPGKQIKVAAKDAKEKIAENTQKVKTDVKQKTQKTQEALATTTNQVVAAVRQDAASPFVQEAKQKAEDAKSYSKAQLMEFTQDILFAGAEDAVSTAESAAASTQQPRPSQHSAHKQRPTMSRHSTK